jgi:hypothetical protein
MPTANRTVFILVIAILLFWLGANNKDALVTVAS